MEVWKMSFLFKGVIFFSFQGGVYYSTQHQPTRKPGNNHDSARGWQPYVAVQDLSIWMIVLSVVIWIYWR